MKKTQILVLLAILSLVSALMVFAQTPTPTTEPTVEPTETPTTEPTHEPTPTTEPTETPTVEPTPTVTPDENNMCPYSITTPGLNDFIFASCNVPEIFTPGLTLVKALPTNCWGKKKADMCLCCLGCVDVGTGQLDAQCLIKNGCHKDKDCI